LAEVTVFVDNAVLGTLPPICAKEGIPTADRLTLHCEVGGATRLGVAWLLILAGPLGWLGLGIIAFMRRPSEWLTVNLPFSERAYRLHRAALRMQRIWFLVSFLAVVLALASYRALHSGTIAATELSLFALGALVAGILEWRRARRTEVKVDLDASRRWVTLSGVHPGFARAVQGPEPLRSAGTDGVANPC
jgi:hypothetical protein